MIESNFSSADICYAHFCHRYYLRNHRELWRGRVLQKLLRRMDHWLHAFAERFIYSRVPLFIVPSTGLKTQIELEYPSTMGRVEVIHNPIELRRLERPVTFDRETFRQALRIQRSDCALVFVALGHFERKGLAALLRGISEVDDSHLRLLVVGGRTGSIASYSALADRLGLTGRIEFVGRQDDVSPYLWAGDAFVLPSSYETFSLAAYEAAAAGLPLIVTCTSGIEDIVRDGENGIVIRTDCSSIAEGIRKFLRLGPDARRRMGTSARESVQRYSTTSFVNAWRAVYCHDSKSDEVRFCKMEAR